MQHPCDEECPSGISRLAGHTSPQIPAGEAQGGKARGLAQTFADMEKTEQLVSRQAEGGIETDLKKLNNCQFQFSILKKDKHLLNVGLNPPKKHLIEFALRNEIGCVIVNVAQLANNAIYIFHLF